MQFQDIFNWLISLTSQYGYFGVFLISAIGAASIFFPIPDTAVVFTLGGSLLFEPALIAIVAAIGAALGEFSGYLLGYGGRKAIIKRYRKNMDFIEKIFRKFGSLAIFVFALTPLPDDLIFIPLGIMRYNVIKAFIPAFIGKFIMNLIVVYGGRFFIDAIEDAVGITNDWLPALISMALGIIVFILMLKIDWSKYIEKYLAKKEQH